MAENRKLARDRVAQVARTVSKPRTALELATVCANCFGGMVETYRKRVEELRAAGVLKVAGRKRCCHTGRTVKAYKVVR